MNTVGLKLEAKRSVEVITVGKTMYCGKLRHMSMLPKESQYVHECDSYILGWQHLFLVPLYTLGLLCK